MVKGYFEFEKEVPDIYISHWTKSDNFASHFHNRIEIVFCKSGKQLIVLDEETYTMTAGDVVLIFPNITHELIKQDVPNTELISVISKPDFFTTTYPELITHRPKSPYFPAAMVSRQTVEAFLKMPEIRLYSGALVGWTYIVLSELLNQVELVATRETGSSHLASNLVGYIGAHFKEPLTINHLANEFGYSPSYVTHVFYNQLKIPFRTYLTAVRSEYAAELIRSTSKSLSEIAYECGYTSTATFCRGFKRHFSFTPSEYNQLVKKDSE